MLTRDEIVAGVAEATWLLGEIEMHGLLEVPPPGSPGHAEQIAVVQRLTRGREEQGEMVRRLFADMACNQAGGQPLATWLRSLIAHGQQRLLELDLGGGFD